MKIRHGFVSNSSSSSFMVPLKYVSALQLQQIIDHEDCGDEYAAEYPWSIEMRGKKLMGSTWMDNFDMSEYMVKIGIDLDKVIWDESVCLSDFDTDEEY